MRYLLVFLLLFGCASAKFDRNTGILEYNRAGNQEMDGLSIKFSETRPDGTVVKFETSLDSQKSEREIAEILIAVSQNIDKALEILKNLESKIPGVF
jgi:hypothetical protein